MKSGLSVLIFVVLISCGKDPKVVNQESSSEERSAEAVIVGDIDWRDIDSSNSYEREAASPVGMLDIPKINSRCTAFMITDSIAITNNHCIKDRRIARGAKITFNYTSRKSRKKSYKCDKFLHTNRRLDYTLLKCRNKPGERHGKVVFSNRSNFSTGEPVLVTHYNCDYHNDYYCTPYLKFSSGSVVGQRQASGVLYYDADTLGGSSGSPVFYQSDKDNKYYLVALHNKGYGNGQGNGRGRYNSGVMSSSLVDEEGRLINKSYLDHQNPLIHFH